MTVSIIGFGTATPQYRIAQTAAYNAAEQLCCDSDDHRRVMGLIYQGTGVDARRSVVLQEASALSGAEETFFWQRTNEDDCGPTTRARMQKYEECSLELALTACENALAQADQDVAEITHLITVSCSGFSSPGVDIGLIEGLGLSPETARTNIGFMGCHGSFNALRVAKALIDADPQAVVLVCSVELCTIHHHYGWSTEKVTANALFGDGAAAVVCRGFPSQQAPLHTKFEIVRNGTCLLPNSAKYMSWRIGDHGFEMTISRRVPSLIEKHLGSWMERFLTREGLTNDDIHTWAIHGLGPCVLEGFGKALSLPNDQLNLSRTILAEFGNMSSATILFLLDRIRERGDQGNIVAVGLGPGLTVEAMLLKSER